MARDVPKLLELAEERVARSERFLRRQRELIETLRRLGHETADANAVLLEYDGLHSRFIAARDRFERSWNKATYRCHLPGGLRDDCGSFHVVETRES